MLDFTSGTNFTLVTVEVPQLLRHRMTLLQACYCLWFVILYATNDADMFDIGIV